MAKTLENPSSIGEDVRVETLRKDMQKYPKAALAFADKYIHYFPEQERPSLLLEIMHKDPESALKFANIYMPFVNLSDAAKEGFIIGAALKYPFSALWSVESYLPYITDELLIEPLLIELIDKSPSAALSRANSYMKYIPEDDREGIIKKAAEKSPGSALSAAGRLIPYIPEEEREGFIIKAARKAPWEALAHIQEYISFVSEEKRHPLVAQALKASPQGALGFVNRYKEHIPEEEVSNVLVEAMRASPYFAFEYAKLYIPHLPKEQRAELLETTMRHDPANALLLAKDYIKFIPEERRVFLLIQAVNSSPKRALDGIGDYIEFIPEDRRKDVLEEAAQKLIRRLNESEVDEAAYAYISEETKDKLLAINTQRETALETVAALNDMSGYDESVRFADFEHSVSTEIYELMVFGREEVFTSTFIGLFDRFTQAMRAEGKTSLYDGVINPDFEASPAVFLQLASEYGKVDTAIQYIPEEKWREVLEYLAERIEHGETSFAVTFVEIVSKTENPALKQEMLEFLQERYESSSGTIKDLYGVTSSYLNQTLGQDIITLDDPDRYKIEVIENLTKEDLFGADGVHRQLLVYSNDADGHNSYKNWLKRYTDNNAYKVEYKDGYTKIVSLAGEGKLEIYANHPDESADKIIEAIGGKDATIDDVVFQSVIHRGHSYNLENSMPYFSKHNQFVFLGSCGSFKNVDAITEISPLVQVASTKQIGTMYINDPVLYHINESIRKNGQVDWEKEQAYLDSLGDARKKDYILPHKNIALMINQAIHKLKANQVERVVDVNAKQEQNTTQIAVADLIENGGINYQQDAIQLKGLSGWEQQPLVDTFIEHADTSLEKDVPGMDPGYSPLKPT